MPRIRSKIVEQGLGDKVLKLRGMGYSYREIADIITREDNTYLNHQTVWNFVHSEGKYFEQNEPIEMLEEFRRFLADINFHLDRLDVVNAKDKSAFQTYMRKMAHAFESKLKRSYSGQPTSNYDKIRELLVTFSDTLCYNCRQRVLRKVLDHIAEIDDESIDTSIENT